MGHGAISRIPRPFEQALPFSSAPRKEDRIMAAKKLVTSMVISHSPYRRLFSSWQVKFVPNSSFKPTRAKIARSA